MPQSKGSVLFFPGVPLIDFMENRWLLVFFSGVPLESVGVEGGVSSPTLPCISSSAVHWPGGGDNDPLVVLLVLGGVIAVDTNVIPKLLFLYGSSLLLVLACVLCVLCRLSVAGFAVAQ